MKLSAAVLGFGCACLGIVAGASMGFSASAYLVPACVVALLMLLQSAARARTAAALLALFSLGLFGAAHLGFALSTPAELRALALLPLGALLLAHGVAAALIGFAGFALRVSAFVRLVLLLPALWTFQEWLFAQPDAAIPWIRLGYSQAGGGPFAGAFPIGGSLLAGWCLLAGCAALALALRHGQAARLRCGMLAAGIVGACAVSSQIAWTQPSGSLTVDLVQSGIGSSHKFEAAHAGPLLALYRRAIADSRAELLVSSQLAIPKRLAALPPGYLDELQVLLERRQADALLGLYFDAASEDRYFNGVLGIGSSGIQHHVKHRLFPFGETLPLPGFARDWLLATLRSPMHETAAGPASTEPLRAGRHRAAVAVCFEAAFGDAWRVPAATADLLINVSSDSAVDSAQLSRQFRQVVQARARELQKPLLRTSDVRGTYVVDAGGRISDELLPGAHGVLHAVVETRSGLTPYARHGDAVPLGVAVLAAAAALLSLRRSRRVVRPAAPAGARVAAQSGQVLPASIVFLLIIGGLFYLMANAGQTVTEKIRVTNAADAAAYSAAVVEARALNYDAYINRAMVANQIAIAQMVSFSSWVNYFATAADNFGANATDVNFFLLPNPKVAVLDVAFAGTAFVAAYFGGRQVQDYADYIVDGAGIIITVHDVAVRALSLSQKAVHANLTLGIRQGQIAKQVAQAMDPRLDAEVVRVSHGFDLFTKNYGRHGGSGDERGRFADVTTRSRDEFTRERNWTVDSFDIPLVRRDPSLKKRGGTDLVGYDEWRAVDTLELHGRRFGCGRFGLSWCDDIRKPIGWGAIEVDAGGGDVGPGHHGNAYVENPTTAQQADSAMKSPPYAMFSGLPDSREIRNIDPSADVSTGITVRVSKAQADTLTSGNAAKAKPSGSLALFNDHPAAGQIAALSRAQVFFDRIAARADGKDEIGSLYNPYWRVRLVAPTVADRAYAATRQGGLALP